MSEGYYEYLEEQNIRLFIPNNIFKITNDAILLAKYVREYIKGKNFKNILDIGTGSGILSLYISDIPNIEIDAIEIQNILVNILNDNLINNNLHNKIKVINEDIRKYEGKKYDIIISNPPYYKANSGKLPENDILKYSKFDLLLNISDFIKSINRLLNNDGVFIIIMPMDRMEELKIEIKKNKLYIEDILEIKDKKTFYIIRGKK